MKGINLLLILMFFGKINFAQSINPIVQNVAGAVAKSNVASLDFNLGESSSIVNFNPLNGPSLMTGYLQSFFSVITSINNYTLIPDETVMIYPNPVSSYLNIRFNTSSLNYYEIKIFDLASRLIYNVNGKTSGPFENRINIKNISSGEFLIYISLNKESLPKQKRVYKFLKL